MYQHQMARTGELFAYVLVGVLLFFGPLDTSLGHPRQRTSIENVCPGGNSIGHFLD